MKKETGKKVRLLCGVFFACYILLLIYLMFFSEEWGRSILGGDYRYNLVPFREIRRYLKYRGTIGSWRGLLQAGSCDVDDLMLNTLGGCLGYALHRLVVSGGKHEKEKN